MLKILDTIGLILIIIFIAFGLLIFGAIFYGVVELLINEWREERNKKDE